MLTFAAISALLVLLFLLGDRLEQRGHWLSYPILIAVGVVAWLPVQVVHYCRLTVCWVLDGREVR